MEYYEGPVDIYDADGELVAGGVTALLEHDEQGRWWGRLREEDVTPPTLQRGLVGVSGQKAGQVQFRAHAGPDLAGRDFRDVDFVGVGKPPAVEWSDGGSTGWPH